MRTRWEPLPTIFEWASRVPLGGSPLLQQGELDFSPAKENLVLNGLQPWAPLNNLPSIRPALLAQRRSPRNSRIARVARVHDGDF
jgi:hypothetical protein